jgi:hypothetical protein
MQTWYSRQYTDSTTVVYSYFLGRAGATPNTFLSNVDGTLYTAVLTISRAQAEWRAKKRREFEEKRRRREERDHAITVSKVAARTKGDGADYMRPQKKPRLEDHDELDGLHHHHMHHHHHHHHLHHADHIDHIHHHHHHHDPHDMALQLPGDEDGHETMDHLREVTDQKLAQARWREQKRRELAERKAKKKNYRRGKRAGSGAENSGSADFGSHITEAVLHTAERELIVADSVPPSGAASSHIAEAVSHVQPVSTQFAEPLNPNVTEPTPASELKQMAEPSHHLRGPPSHLTAASRHIGETMTQPEEMHIHHHSTHHHELPVDDPHPIPNPHSPSQISAGLDVTLSAQAAVHQSQTQGLTAEQVLGHPDDDQDLHNNLLNSWQSLDPLAPAQ